MDNRLPPTSIGNSNHGMQPHEIFPHKSPHAVIEPDQSSRQIAGHRDVTSSTAHRPGLESPPLSRRFSLPSAHDAQKTGRIIIGIWAFITVLLAMRVVLGILLIHRLKRSLRPATDPRLVVAARQALTAAGKPRTAVCESPLVPAPLTLGWWRSMLVMPTGLTQLLNDEQLACVLAHEAAHVARHDTTIALLQQMTSAAFWWNPLLRVVNWQINQLRERICDDACR